MDKKIFEIRKSVTFLGAGYQSVIQGSLVKWGSGKLRFENLRLLIGEEKDDNEEIYLVRDTNFCSAKKALVVSFKKVFY